MGTGISDWLPAHTVELSVSSLTEVARAAIASGAAMWLRVTGSSMTPLLREGDSVLLVQADSVRVGEIVLTQWRQSVLLHRVVDRRGTQLRTRGDACFLHDPETPAASVLGKAVLARRGDHIVALTATVRFGIVPFARYLAWSVRVWGRQVFRFLRNARVFG